MEKLSASLCLWLLGAPLYLPWELARLGIYKRWYFAPFMPPFSWRRGILIWPMSAFFVCALFIPLLTTAQDTRMDIWAGVGIAGFILAMVMVLWNPRWSKPAWQRRLEDRYSHAAINDFLQVWKHMDFEEWSRLIETEEGLAQLVQLVRERRSIVE